MGRSAFITGISGQDGAYLAAFLLDKGYEVHGGIRSVAHSGLERLEFLGLRDRIRLHPFDLADHNNIFRVLREVSVDEVYNLAAQSFVGASWDNAIQALDIHAMGTARLLDTLRTLGGDTRIFQASSSEIFGTARTCPQTELTALAPRAPYGTGKVMAHCLVENYRTRFGMHASCGILYNHESPLRGRQFVTRKITLALARIAAGAPEICRLGNLSARRDWGYAPEYVEGMWRMLQQDQPEDFILATGIGTTVRDFATHAAAALGIEIDWEGSGAGEVGRRRSDGRIIVAVDPEFYRPAEAVDLIGDAAKARDRLGWSAQTDVATLAALMARAEAAVPGCALW